MNIPKAIIMLCTILFMCTTFASAATVDITATGSNDQIAINNAINAAQPGDTINLHGIFLISNPIKLKSDIIIKGDGIQDTIIKAASPTYFEGTHMILLSGVKNVELCDFTIHGGATSVENQHENGGKGDDHSGIKIDDSSSCKIHDIYFTKLYGDGIRAGTVLTRDINVYNCQFMTSGHDAVQVWNGENWRVSNCLINVFINCGVRFAGCTNCVIEHCTMYGDGNSGWCEIELENAVNNVTIDHNILRDMHGSTGNYAIATVNARGTITLSNNVIYGCSGGVNTAGIDVTEINNQYNNTNIPDDVGFTDNLTIIKNTSNFTEYIPLQTNNLTEIALSVTQSPTSYNGTGRYQSILNMSTSGYSNQILVTDMTKVLYWTYPDISSPYASVVTGYKPTVTI